MITRDIKSLLSRLNGHLSVTLEAAAGLALSRTHNEVYPDHLILKLIEEGTGDVLQIFKRFEIDYEDLTASMNRGLSRFTAGSSSRPRFSRDILELLEQAWMISTIHYNQTRIRSGSLIEAILEDPRFDDTPLGDGIKSIEVKTLREEFFDIVAGSSENIVERGFDTDQRDEAAVRQRGGNALDMYTIDVTGRAREGEIDPVYGRDKEIRQAVDILCRRRKNNPILVGEAGVGKTAIVEGLAMRIVTGDVIDSLKDVEIRGLDLGMLQAGAGAKGEFENRLKKVINEVMDSGGKIILFIDEAHTLIGAGGAAGSGDAANLLKPALARGKLRTIGATTFSEYKKYIEKDPALERRFQMVKIDEPDEETGIIMMRGIKNIYEEHHGLSITDSAVRASVSLAKRYITGRQLPDKSVDLLDTAAARVKLTSSGKPRQLELLERQTEYANRKLESLIQDQKQGYTDDADEIEKTKAELLKLEEDIVEITERWKTQQKLADKMTALKEELKGDDEKKVAEATEKLIALRKELHELHKDDPLVLPDVDEVVVASVVADWTGIPVGRMVKDQAAALLNYEEIVGDKIIGQDQALKEVADSIRVTKSGMGSQDNPIGVFLFVGPSGVGKTETARYTAEVLFGGEKFMTVINMSEYQEKHTVSQLKGSPPGYVGYGEGGVLTEAVRRRPYSVVILDEVEKADREVMNLFYQVFDRGFMRDGEGREIDFKNTIIMMTSNLGTDLMMDACKNGERPDAETMIEIIRPELTQYFQTALLARIKVIPFFPLDAESIKKIVDLKLGALVKRMEKSHGIEMSYDKKLVGAIAANCTQPDTGARNVDYIIERQLLPDISRNLVERMASENMPEKLILTSNKDGTIKSVFK